MEKLFLKLISVKSVGERNVWNPWDVWNLWPWRGGGGYAPLNFLNNTSVPAPNSWTGATSLCDKIYCFTNHILCRHWCVWKISEKFYRNFMTPSVWILCKARKTLNMTKDALIRIFLVDTDMQQNLTEQICTEEFCDQRMSREGAVWDFMFELLEWRRRG